MKYWNGNKNVVTTLTVVLAIALAGLPLAAVTRGATVLVTMVDGSRVRGELLAVKMDTMIIYDPGTGKKWDLDLQQVTQVRIKRDSKFLLGAVVGLVVGLRIADSAVKAEDKAGLFFGSQSALMVPMTSLLCGYIAGIASRDKKISLAGELSPAEQNNLKRLKHYAREQDPVQSPGLH